ncbi:MAG: hypothetical protein RJB39_94 [Candidatus Parcubacteria bacterium]|jgi:hypothetical protein
MLDKSQYKLQRQGITLIELILYMSLFAILVSIVFSTVFYLQKLFTNKKIEYIVRAEIYEQLNLLQQHLVLTQRVEVGPEDITLYMYGSTDPRAVVKIRQYIDGGRLVMEYLHNDPGLDKKIYVHEYTVLQDLSFSLIDIVGGLNTFSRQSVLAAHITWKNSRQKTILIDETLYIPNLE